MMIVFSRDYCTPCRVMKPWVTEVAEEHTAIDVVSVNIDRRKYEHFGRFFQVSAVPTLVFADADGRVSARREGLATEQQMTATLRRLGWVD
jgi:thiol-disulfide isomerase/thioredoxin